MGAYFQIPSILNSFWWGPRANGKRKLNWFTWERLYLRKEEGGLGFRNLHDFNLAMLAKKGWSLIPNSGSLVARLLKTSYYQNGAFLIANLGHNPSFIWRGVWKSRQIMENGCNGEWGMETTSTYGKNCGLEGQTSNLQHQ